jgi:hypothetical protein
MTDMNEEDIIRCFADIADYELDESIVAEDIARTRKLLAGRPAADAPRKPLWRVIMTSKWTRLSSAAIFLIAAVSVTINLSSNSKLEASELLAQMARNMENLTWLKSITKRYVPDQNEAVGTDEHWIDAKNKRVYAIYDSKYIHLMDYSHDEWSIYRPDTNDMIVKPFVGEWTSPEAQVEEYIEKLKDEGLEVKQTERTDQGHKVMVLEFAEVLNDIGSETPITNMLMNGRYVKTIRNEIVIDRKELRLGATLTYVNRAGEVIAIHRSQTEPIAAGPSDIYELGVPRDVTVINKVPSRAVKAVRQKISDKKAQFLNEYIAVITEADMKNGRENIREAFVVFCQGKKVRVDVYRRRYDARDPLTPRYRTALETSLHYVSGFWPNENERAISSVRLYDGLWQYMLDAQVDKFIAQEKQRRPTGDLYGDDDVEDFTWRRLGWLEEPERMYEDAYSQENGLIAMELTAQAVGSQAPKRFVLYVNPEKDYVCDRYIDQQLLDAPWQEDRTWLESVGNKRSLTDEVRDTRVAEYGRTESGQWYPKVITETGYRQNYGQVRTDIDRIIRIHLVAEHPQFPDGIFDPNRLPGESEGP